MDSWDKRFLYTQSLLSIVSASETPTSSKKAPEIIQKKCQEFVTNVNELMEELKLASWPVVEIEKRWKSIEPLLQEADRLSIPASFPKPQSETSKRAFEPPLSSSNLSAKSIYTSDIPTRSRLNQQYELMEAQDASLLTLGDRVGRLKELGKAMTEESSSQSQIIENFSNHVEEMNKKTEKSTEKVKKL